MWPNWPRRDIGRLLQRVEALVEALEGPEVADLLDALEDMLETFLHLGWCFCCRHGHCTHLVENGLTCLGGGHAAS
eukprot:5031980-Pyramimonas_sp.AAC.1